jgi:hypothetical protein
MPTRSRSATGKKIHFSARLSSDVLAVLEERARCDGRSVAEMLERAVIYGLAHMPEPIPLPELVAPSIAVIQRACMPVGAVALESRA